MADQVYRYMGLIQQRCQGVAVGLLIIAGQVFFRQYPIAMTA
jgi:hypothetical protein